MDSFAAYRCSKFGMPASFGTVDEILPNRTSFSIQLPAFHTDDFFLPSPSECEAYESYILFSQLSSHWNNSLWPGWANESIVRPALQSLELSFRMISCILCDVRAYLDKEEWMKRLEGLINAELEVIAMVCEADWHAPLAKLAVSRGVLAIGDAQEVWQRPGAQAVVNRCSQESLLPRLACWSKSYQAVARIRLAIECQMHDAPFTLGLGEPNLSRKPTIEYDEICKPLDVYECRRLIQGEAEDHTLSTVHQIFECWLFVAHRMLNCVEQSIEDANPRNAARLCWMVERVWKILSSTMRLLLLMDADDFMKLKQELAIHASSTSFGGAFCLRSKMLRTVTNLCKELRHFVPKVVGVEADPKGGPRLQEALMELLHIHGAAKEHQNNQAVTIRLLQSFQAIEMAVKEFFFSYHQLVVTIMGSGACKGLYQADPFAADAISQIYLEPPYFPSLNGAKTFLGEYWRYKHNCDDIEQEVEMRKRSSNSSKNSSMCSSTSTSTSTSNDLVDLPNSMQVQQSSWVE